MKKALKEWLASRPPLVRRLAAEFPLGMTLQHGGRTLRLIGYNEGGEDGMLVFAESHPEPGEEHDRTGRVYVCAAHLRKPA